MQQQMPASQCISAKQKPFLGVDLSIYLLVCKTRYTASVCCKTESVKCLPFPFLATERGRITKAKMMDVPFVVSVPKLTFSQDEDEGFGTCAKYLLSLSTTTTTPAPAHLSLRILACMQNQGQLTHWANLGGRLGRQVMWSSKCSSQHMGNPAGGGGSEGNRAPTARFAQGASYWQPVQSQDCPFGTLGVPSHFTQ